MPELPEAETVKNIVEPQIKNCIIEQVIINREEVIARPLANQFIERTVGARIVGMGRRGKFLLVLLDNQQRIALHLRMTGQLLVTPPDFEVEKHTHIIFQLNGGKELRFADPRRFGRFWLLKNTEEDVYTGMQKLGLEPFDQGMTAQYLRDCMQKSKASVKQKLLDQSIIAGIGNIYADEILFRAQIHPQKACCSLNDKEWENLSWIIPKTLQWGIDTNQMTAADYLAGKGKEYRNTPLLQVYGRKGSPCPRCGAALESVRISGRSSCYCAVCQR